MRYLAFRPSVAALVFVVVAACPAPSYADYCPPDSELSGGMRDIMLCYLADGRWAADDFLPYVAHLDKSNDGEPTDWFFDSFMFMMFGGAPSGGAYYNGTANKADWNFYLDLLFSEDHNMAALDRALQQVGEKLGDDSRVCPVILMIPYLASATEGFGDVDGDGADENPADDADRLKAFRWITDALLKRWEARRYKHLKLWGLYWMHEGVGGRDHAVVKQVADYVHSKGVGLHWIPWFRAPGYEQCHEVGFDFTIMQPNFAFMTTPGGLAVPDQGRLSINAALARDLGLGVEMEMNMGVATDPGQRMNLQLYVNHGVDELDGYMNGAVRAWYQAYELVAGLYRSDLPINNRLYDDLYRLHKGTYRRRALSLCEGAPATVNGKVEAKLTDGLWLTRDEHADRIVSVPPGSVIDVPLKPMQMIGDVRVHVSSRPNAAPCLPSSLRIFTSQDGQNFTEALQLGPPRVFGTGEYSGGFALASFAPRLARVLRVEVSGSDEAVVGIDEVIAYPAPHPIWGDVGHISGQDEAQLPVDPSELTDGRVGSAWVAQQGLRLKESGGSVQFDLGDVLYLGEVVARANRSDLQPSGRCRAILEGAGEAYETPWTSPGADADGWIRIPMATVAARRVRFELSGGEGIAWDELQVRAAENLALHRSYSISPAFDAKYPDSGGRELTDEQLSARGFSDGRTVGWWEARQVTLDIDLGAEQEIDGARVHAQGGGYAAVRYPAVMEIWGSSDGERWSHVMSGEPEKEVTFTEDVGEETQELAWLRLACPPRRARFVRLRVDATWWLMLSEVQVLSGGENLAAGRSYRTVPIPTSSAEYPDDGGKLTDGYHSRARHDWRKAVGWHDGSPEVVIDLLKPATVSTVRAHFQGGGAAGVCFPISVSVATSKDGKTWTEEATAEGLPKDAGSGSTGAFVDVALAPRSGRFVRVRAQRKGWLMIDEIEVYGGATTLTKPSVR